MKERKGARLTGLLFCNHEVREVNIFYEYETTSKASAIRSKSRE